MFNKKCGPSGNVENHKAWLVAKGYSQVEGIDYGEIFSLVANMTSIKLMLSLTTSYDL